MSVTWFLDIDWNNDGSFAASEDESYYLRDLTIRRGREFYLQADGYGFEPVRAGEATCLLDNQSLRFDPYNTSSPLYPNVKPGRRVRIRVKLNETPFTEWTIFTGQISDIQQGGVDDKTATLSAIDDLSWLDQRELNDSLQQNYAVADAISDALIAAGWVAAGRSYSVDDNGDLVFWWWTQGLDALGAIRALENNFIGKAFVSADGTFKFYSRHHLYSTALTLTQADISKEIAIPQPWEVVRNIINIYTYPRSRGVDQILWDLSSPIYIDAGASYTLFCNYSSGGGDCPATDIISPVATTDYLANSIDDGTGTNLTADISIVCTAYGTKAKLVITNNGSIPAYMIFLQLRGDPLTAVSYILTQEEDATSQSLYLPRDFTLDDPCLQNPNIAVDLAGFLISWLAYPTIYPTLQIDTNPAKQFSVDLFDQISLSISALGVSDNYLISYIEHNWTAQSGQAFTTTFVLEPPIDVSGFWIFSTNIGTTSYFGF